MSILFHTFFDKLRGKPQVKKGLAIKSERVIMVNENNIDYNELGKRLATNRSKIGRGHGKSYWKAQGRVAVEYLKEVSNHREVVQR